MTICNNQPVKYFLYKEAVYGHGVFWIGNDIEEGKLQADRAANLDRDNHHHWVLYEFLDQEDHDFADESFHKEIYCGVRIQRNTTNEDIE